MFNARTRTALKAASTITALVFFMSPWTTPLLWAQTAAFEIARTGDGISLVFVKDDGSVGIGTTSPNSRLEVDGVIHTTTGFKFPDGSIQTSASTGVSGGVPLGTVIDWWAFPGESIPDGFALCDGNTITDAASPFNGQSTPDLVSKFIYGTATLSDINDNAGGSETVNLSHSHGLGSHTHSFSATTEGSTSDTSVADGGKDAAAPGHAHNYSGTTGPAGGNTSAALSTVSILPPHARLLKIIRIR